MYSNLVELKIGNMDSQDKSRKREKKREKKRKKEKKRD